MRTVSVGFNVYISSKIGAEGMGLITLTGTIYGFAITFATSGINLAVVRLVSGALPYGDDSSSRLDKKSSKSVSSIMRNALLYCLIFSVLASVILFISAKNIGVRLLNDKRCVPSLKFLALSLVPISISSALNGYFCAVRRVYKNVIVQVCEQGFKIAVVSMLLMIIAPDGLEYACMAVIGGGAFSEAFSVILSLILYLIDRKIHNVKNSGDTKAPNTKKYDKVIFGRFLTKDADKKSESQGREYNFSSVFYAAFPVAISAYARSALSTIEHLVIPWGLKRSGISSAASLASYGVLHGMVFPILLFPSAVLGAFSSMLVPELASSKEVGDTKRIKYIVSRVFALTLLFSLGVSGVFISFSYEIGTYIYKSNEAVEFIKMLAPLIPLMYLDGAVDTMLKGLGEQLYTMRVNIMDSLFSVALLLVLLPSFGIKGYIIVIFITEIFNTSCSIIKLLDITNVQPPIIKWIVKPLITIIFSTSVVRLIFDMNILSKFFGLVLYGKSLAFFEICLAAILYIVFAKIFGAISKDDIKWAKGLIKNK